jgi:hypothetical protein
VGQTWADTEDKGYFTKGFPLTFYDDIAKNVKPNPNVTRYMGTPDSNGSCIEIEAWAADTCMVKFILSNKPTSSFVQINTLYTNMETDDDSAFGFFSSRSKSRVLTLTARSPSEDSLVYGSKTRHLGFRPRQEYNP